MKKTPITLPENELEVWAQICQLGEWPGEQDGRPVTQVCDAVAFDRLVSAFKPEILIDFEHRSVNSDDTTAAGWAQQLRWSPEAGLECYMRCTDIGAEDIRNRRRRFLSPVWRLDQEGRPIKLRSIGLTNDPNFDLNPVLNKASPGTADPKPGASKIDPPPQKAKKMKDLAAVYGLPETATEAEITAAAQAVMDELTALRTQLDELAAKALDAEADTVATENKDSIEDKDEFKKAYVQNKALALQILACIKKPEAAPVTNKKEASTPSFAMRPKPDGAVQNKYTHWQNMPAGKEKDAYLSANAVAINADAPQG